MRKLKALGATAVVVTLCMFPAAGALLELGVSLSAIDRMHGRESSRPSAPRETIGTYVVDPTTHQEGIVLHEVIVVHRPGDS